MGDTENSLHSSKKRAAGREISRDNPGLDDDEDSSEQEAGTFKKASEEVLATRRIVKVRRQPQSAQLSSNPFAGIKLIAPTTCTVTDPETKTETKTMNEKMVLNDVDVKNTKSSDENEKVKEEGEGEDEDVCKKSEENKAEKEEKEEKEGEDESKAQAEEVKPVADKSDDAEKKDESTPLNSFQRLSSSQNAFTNLSGTGFSASTFSFGSIKSDGPGFGGAGSLFGLKTDGPSFGLGLSNNGSSSLKNETTSKSQTMKEVEVATGEENEEAVFSADAVLYEFMGGGWKERGKGEVKLNVSKPEKDKARLVMRSKGNYRLILNANVFPDMKFTPMEKKGLSFACMNSTGDPTTGEFSTFALKFRDPSIVEDFCSSVAAYRGKIINAPAAVLKTPENSPKASDE